MSYEDAQANTDRATRLRQFVALHRQMVNRTDKVLTYTGRVEDGGPEIAVTLDLDLLLSAAEALDAVGMAGYTAARLEAYIVTGDPTAADLYLEAALNPEATFRDHRAQMGAADADKLIGQIRADLEENQP